VSKKFSKELCVYCAAYLSASPDHVIARSFFLKDRRDGLPQVPACKTCNNEKSRLETYLAAVLPFGGIHPDARAHLNQMVPPRLAKNARLHRELAESQAWIQAHIQGRAEQRMVIAIETEALERWVRMLVKGLAWYHWRIYLREEHEVLVTALTPAGEAYYEERIFRLNARNRVQVALGHGTVTYEGMQGVDCPEVTAWRIQLLGGIQFGGDPNHPDLVSSLYGALTGPVRVWDRAAEKVGAAGRPP
jgi:hypothetical protein